MACQTCPQTSPAVPLGGLTITGCTWYSKGQNSALIPCAATVTNAGQSRLIVLAVSKSLQAERGFALLPGETAALPDPGSSGWEVYSQPESEVQRFGAGMDLVGLGIIAAALYGVYAAGRDISRARKTPR